MDLEEQLSKNRRQFKKGIDYDEARRKREDAQFELRKQTRESQVAKRRQQAQGAVPVEDSAADDEDRTPAQTHVTPERLQQLVQGVNSDDPAAQLDATTTFRKLLSIERNPPIQEVINTGVVPRLVTFLTQTQQAQLQFEAAWALTNIASGTSAHTNVVVDNGAVDVFVRLLRSRNPEVAEQAVWALGNIAGDSTHHRDVVLQAGALQPLLALCGPDAKLSMLRNATWTLSNLCRGKPQPDFEMVRPALTTLAQLLYSKDDEVLTDACWALSYLSDDTGPNNQKIQAVIGSGVARRLVELLLHRSANVRTPALRTVGNIVTGDDLQTEVIIRCAALPCLLALLNNPKKGIRKEACWTISNITAGNHEQIQAVIEANIIPPLVSLLRNAEFDIKKEAAWAISNATSGGTDEQIRYLVDQAVIPPLCELLVCDDPKIIMVALEGIENILKVGQKEAQRTGGPNRFAQFVEAAFGLDKLEQLQQHSNHDIYEKSLKILKAYFETEEATDGAMAPAAAGNQFAFNPTSGTGGFQF